MAAKSLGLECQAKEDAYIEKAYADVIAYERERDEHNAALVKSVSRRAPKMFKELLEYCYVTGKIERVDKPSGRASKQHEHYGPFRDIHVDQWSVGIEGDSYEGDIYAKTAKLGWIKIPFSC